MSGMDLLEQELSESAKVRADLSGFDRTAGRKPPTNWGAARAKSKFDEQAVVSDQAGPQGGAQGGGAGPSLPFRIREVQMVPKALGSAPVFSIAKPQLKTDELSWEGGRSSGCNAQAKDAVWHYTWFSALPYAHHSCGLLARVDSLQHTLPFLEAAR
eukprot:CAMPEP_0175763318 /NCGR_PEP_ID=MMETSP0097-20121207/67683_1 /TAXON_ID=311494 /ORGANISM="Alexandrium monilatum, Strain CCMP3105" /LENGTH=156 /DNA_ID=CAMNT_0017073059 /DNA_START=6 /DNA_END=474 /DNA_ORIENTATION=+